MHGLLATLVRLEVFLAVLFALIVGVNAYQRSRGRLAPVRANEAHHAYLGAAIVLFVVASTFLPVALVAPAWLVGILRSPGLALAGVLTTADDDFEHVVQTLRGTGSYEGPLHRYVYDPLFARFAFMRRLTAWLDKIFGKPSVAAGLVALALLWPAALSGQSSRYRRDGRAILPDPALTPGLVATSDTAVVCHRSTKTVRNTSAKVKAAAYAEYGIRAHKAGQYEVDHLISLELGGADSLPNLWPEPAAPKPGFHQKDALENKLHALACSGAIALAEAQREIATNWYAAWIKYVGPAAR